MLLKKVISLTALTVLFCLKNNAAFAQSKNISNDESYFFTPEILIGKTLEANTFFPERKLQKNIFLSIGKNNYNTDKEWAARLNYPATGVSFGYSDFGNIEKIGRAYSVMPFIEFSILKSSFTNNLNLHVGLGGSYTDTQYNKNTNPFNRAITTKINWSFRSFIYYTFLKSKKTDWRFGLGYLHHSNGHTSLPNQGLNSLAASISAKLKKHKEPINFKKPEFSSKSQTYFSSRIGIGQNVLSEKFNTKKEVYSISASAGKIINNTFKFGGGFYYRFYEHYYDYIKNNEALVEEQYPHFADNPYGYATNFGLFATSELLIDHFGFEFDLGLNVFKPFYKIDWKLNQGYSYQNADGETIEILGELDWYYEIKRTVSARMGLKYYLWSTNKAPKRNIFIGVHINANLGQADFTELSLGYVYRFNLKSKK
jgi:hypothetical protein